MDGTFPHDECEALAMLYVQTQDLSNYTPEQILALYDKAYGAMVAAREAQTQKDEEEEWL